MSKTEIEMHLTTGLKVNLVRSTHEADNIRFAFENKATLFYTVERVEVYVRCEHIVYITFKEIRNV